MGCSDKPTLQRLAEEAARLTLEGEHLQDRAVNIIVPLRRRVAELEATVSRQDGEIEALRQQLKEKGNA